MSNQTLQEPVHFDKMSFPGTCENTFHRPVAVHFCLNAVLRIMDFDRHGLSQCPTSTRESLIVEHNHDFFFSDCGNIERRLSQFALPPLILACIFGNLLNLLIYRLPYFDGSSSVHFLRAKAIANMIFVSSRFLEVIHSWMSEPREMFEAVFWHSRPYILTISNISGTMSTWLTLMVTVETAMCVLTPFLFRQYCTKRVTFMFLGVSLVLATLLHLTLIWTTTISEMFFVGLKELDNGPCWRAAMQYTPSVASHPLASGAQRLYFWVQMAVTIAFPTLAMLVCTLVIVKQFTFKNLGEAFSQRRKCVIRMTVATTLSHLLLEGPATLTFTAFALKGALASEHNHLTCVLNHGNNMLSVVNATIPFFVFLACNVQFRHMTAMWLRAQTESDTARRGAYLAAAGARYSRSSQPTGATVLSRVLTDGPSFNRADVALLSKVSSI